MSFFSFGLFLKNWYTLCDLKNKKMINKDVQITEYWIKLEIIIVNIVGVKIFLLACQKFCWWNPFHTILSLKIWMGVCSTIVDIKKKHVK